MNYPSLTISLIIGTGVVSLWAWFLLNEKKTPLKILNKGEVLTGDLGGSASTEEITAAIISEL